jgi:GNAT superfamily N-acetyltransferase
MATHIRPGKADDMDFLAWVMLSASRAHLPRGIWDLIIGSDEQGCLDYLRRLVVAEPRSLCHYEAFLVVDVDGELGAGLCGFEFRTGGWATVAVAMTKVQHDLGWTESDVAASHKRVAPVWTCLLPDIGADWGIENIATKPQHRHRGLASMLLNEIVREGRERGCKLAQITTFVGHGDAERLYKKAGFRAADEKRCNEMAFVLNTPGFVRFTREL